MAGGTLSVYLSNVDYDGFPWTNAVDKYLAVRMEINGSMHYGWIRMDVAAHTASVTIKDFALNLDPGTPIRAGDKGAVAVHNLPAPGGDLSVSTLGKSIIVQFAEPSGALRQVTVYTLLGARVASRVLCSERTAIALPGCAAGCYVAVVHDGARMTAKMVRVW